MASNKKKTVLKGQDAIDLWLQGIKAWNDWVKNHPNAEVDFSGVDFSSYRIHEKIPEKDWPFAYFKFPNGNVHFYKSRFGDGDVRFHGAEFGEGKVSFVKTEFGNGDVSFIGSRFGDGDVIFILVRIRQGSFEFWGTTLGKGRYLFDSVTFEGSANFAKLKNTISVEEFSFKYSTFVNSFEFSSMEPFDCIVDLTSTRMANQFSLEGLKCTLRKKKYLDNIRPFARFLGKNLSNNMRVRLYRWILCGDWFTRAKALDKGDIERLRRLKEIAENNRDHKKALEFHVMEMQAARWHESSWADLALEFWFQKLGDYGRSEIRPICWMIGFWFAFAGVYAQLSNSALGFWNKLPTALTFSAGQMFPFIPSSRDARLEGAETLFVCKNLPDWVYLFIFPQSIFSIILLFLLGLALRNRFRV